MNLCLSGLDIAAVCPRSKKCHSNNNCPSPFCCVQAIDVTMALIGPKTNSYTNNYGNDFNNMNVYGYFSILPNTTREGYCRPSVATGQLPGSDVGSCPCTIDGDICDIIIEPFPVGKCKATGGGGGSGDGGTH
ncbi:hypothetical protein Btru_076560 [Bulinus truncatus]|nr:hypothetical protein Btru_076560 [Bulinus truncatus]